MTILRRVDRANRQNRSNRSALSFNSRVNWPLPPGEFARICWNIDGRTWNRFDDVRSPS